MAKNKGLVSTQPPEVEALPALLQAEQMNSPDREQEPKPVPLQRVKEPDGRGYADQPPVPPVASYRPAPRFIHQNERAPDGLKRYKIRCTNYGEQPIRYVLASDESEAREHYLRATGLNAMLDRLREDGMEKIEQPRLSIRSLRD